MTRFTHRNAITAFAGVDPGADQSGTRPKSTRFSKGRAPELRRALFLVMDCLLKTQPQDDPVAVSWTRTSRGQNLSGLHDSLLPISSQHLLWQSKRISGILWREIKEASFLVGNDTAFTLKTSYDRKRAIKMFFRQFIHLRPQIMILEDSAMKLPRNDATLSSRYFADIARGKTAPTILTLEKLCVGFDRRQMTC